MSYEQTLTCRLRPLLATVPVLLLIGCGGSSESFFGAGATASQGTSPSSSPSSSSSSTTTGSAAATAPTNTGSGSISFTWAIPFAVSGLQDGDTLVVLLNNRYPFVISKNLAPPSGWYVYAPGQPPDYPGLLIGSSYTITIGQQPNSEICSVANESGALSATIAPVAANITYSSTSNSGVSSLIHASLRSGQLSAGATHALTLSPPARQGASTFTDLSGNFWMFGGRDDDAAGNATFFNDLWKFSPYSGGWMLVAGSDTQSVDSANIMPVARDSAAIWTDANGDVWLFGGEGRDAKGTVGLLGDLWKLNVATNTWAPVAGPILAVGPDEHNVAKQPSATNMPGARKSAASWVDPTGNLWLFGGQGAASEETAALNDLWEFIPATGRWSLENPI